VRSELALKSDNYLLCRDQHHRWDDSNVIEEPKNRLLRIIQKCPICTSERTLLLSLAKHDYGFIISSRISHYAQDYLLPKGSGRLDKADRGEIRMKRRGY